MMTKVAKFSLVVPMLLVAACLMIFAPRVAWAGDLVFADDDPATSNTSGKTYSTKVTKVSTSSQPNKDWSTYLPVKNGTYYLEAADGSDTLVGLAKAKASKVTLVSETRAAKLQAWIITYNYYDKAYTIQNAKTKKMLTFSGGSITQKKEFSNKSGKKKLQQWTVEATKLGYKISPLTKPKVSLACNGGKVVGKKSAKSKAQRFWFREKKTFSKKSSLANGVYSLYNVEASALLQMQGKIRKVGTRLTVGSDKGALTQKFYITRVGSRGNTYRIVNSASSMAMSVSGSRVVLAKVSSSNHQKWVGVPQSNGTFLFKNKGTGEYLQVNGQDYATTDDILGEVDSSMQWIVSPTITGLNYYQELGLEWANTAQWAKLRGGKSAASSTVYYITIDKTAHRCVIWKNVTKAKNSLYQLCKDWKCTTVLRTGKDYEHNKSGYDFQYKRGKTSGSQIADYTKVYETGYSFTAKYYTALGWGVGIHSILYQYMNYPRVKDGALGLSRSGGCTRLATDNAYWVFKNILRGTGNATYYQGVKVR